MKKAFIKILIVLAVISAVLFLSGYRLTPEAAARANVSVGGNSALVLRTNAPIGETFVYRVKDYYVLVAPYRQGFLWRSNVASSSESIDDKNDPVRSLGCLSISSKTQSGAVWIVQSQDSRVAAFKVESTLAAFDENGIAVMTWNKPLIPAPSDVSAIGGDGKTLYIYGDNDGKDNFIDLTKTKWYEV